jgi:hypothetical protein
VMGACLVASCNSNARQDSSMELDPATAAYQKHGYNTLPVEAHLGPHRFMIPANYFRDQIGPDFQGNFSLLVQWPHLQPLPPGKRSGQDMETFDRQITIAPRHVDRVPIETRLEASTIPIAPPGSASIQHPAERLDRMLPQPERDGLTPYVVDLPALEAFRDAEALRLGMRRTPIRRDSLQDWFVRRDGRGKLVTLVKCNLEPEPGDDRRPSCTHDFVIPELDVAVSMDYGREYLSGWQRIEDRARALILQSRVD